MGVRWCLLISLAWQMITITSVNGLTIPFTSLVSTSRPMKPSPLPESSPDSASPSTSLADTTVVSPSLNNYVTNSFDTVVLNKPSPTGIHLKSILQIDPIIIKSPTMEACTSPITVSPTSCVIDYDVSSPILKTVSLHNPVLDSTRDINNIEIKAQQNAFSNSPITVPLPNILTVSKAPIVIKPNLVENTCLTDNSASPRSFNSVHSSKTINSPSFLSPPNLSCTNFIKTTNAFAQTLPESSTTSSFVDNINLLSNLLPKCPIQSKSTDVPTPGLSLPIASAQSITMNCLSSTENCYTSSCPESLSSTLNIIPGSLPLVNISPVSNAEKAIKCPIIYRLGSISVPFLSALNNLSYLELLGSPTFRLPTPHVDLSLIQSPTSLKSFTPINSISNYTPSNPTIASHNINTFDPKNIMPSRLNFLNRPDFKLPTPNCDQNYFKLPTKLESLSPLTKHILPDVTIPTSDLMFKSEVKCPNTPPSNAVSSISDIIYTPPSSFLTIPKSTSTAACNGSPTIINRNIVLPTIKIRNDNFSSSTSLSIPYLPSSTLPSNPYSCSKYLTSEIRPSSFIDYISSPLTITPPVVKPVIPNPVPPSSRQIKNTECISENMLQQSIIAKSTPSFIDSFEPKILPSKTETNNFNILESHLQEHNKYNNFMPPKVPNTYACQYIAPNIISSPRVTSQFPSTLVTTHPIKLALVKPQAEYISIPNVASSINDVTSAIVKNVMASIDFNNIKKRVPTTPNLHGENTVTPKSTKPIIINPISTPAIIPSCIKSEVTNPISTIPTSEINTLSILDDNTCKNKLSNTDDYLLSNILNSLSNIQSESTLLSSNLMLPYISSVTVNILPFDEEEDTIIDLTQPEYHNEVNDSEVTLDSNLIDHLLKLLGVSDLLDTKEDKYIDFDVVEEINRLLYAS